MNCVLNRGHRLLIIASGAKEYLSFRFIKPLFAFVDIRQNLFS